MEHKHEGHRERLRNRYVLEGPTGFQDHEMLELYLFAVIPRRNTNDIAHALIDKFGSLRGVFFASPEELVKVPGVGRKTAQFLYETGNALRTSLKKEFAETSRSEPEYKIPDDTVPVLLSLAKEKTKPCIWLLSFNGMFHLHSTDLIWEGNFSMKNYSEIIRKTARTATLRDANYVLTAQSIPRNGVIPPIHPDATPEVFELTDAFSRCFHTIGIRTLDHAVVTDNDCIFVRKFLKKDHI